MKKRIAFVCVAAMLLAMLGGCKGDSPAASTPEENSAVSSSSTTTTTTTTTAEDATTTTTTTSATVTGDPTTNTTNKPTATAPSKSTTTKKPTTTAPRQQQATDALSPYALARADYTYDESRIYDGFSKNMKTYYSKALPAFLSEDPGKNRVCSPLSVYLALAMLAETTGGNSREQILSLLWETDIEAVRKRSAALWNTLYTDTKETQCLLANSLWLDKANLATYRPNTIRRLADDYYASVFQGIMGSAEYDTALRTWLNDNTGGLLKEQVENEKFSKATLLALYNTVYFKATWANEFDEEATREDVFHATAGDVTCDFMHDTMNSRTVYWGDDFVATSRAMYNGFTMWFILPDEGVAVEKMLTSRPVLNMLTGYDSGYQKAECKVVLSLPKFDITYQNILNNELAALGVTDMFSDVMADFSPMFQNLTLPVSVSEIRHMARFMVDEKKVEAAAITGTIIDSGAALPPAETIEFTADRPFMFVVSGPRNTLLFTGIVEDPTQS